MSTQDPKAPRHDADDHPHAVPPQGPPTEPVSAEEASRGPASDAPHHAPDRADEIDLPEQDANRPSAAGWVGLILGAILLVMLLIFVIQNSMVASFTYFGLQFDMQLGIAVLLAAVAGALIAGIIGSVVIVRQGLQLRRMRRERDRIRKTLKH